jgi:hypothetical protein
LIEIFCLFFGIFSSRLSLLARGQVSLDCLQMSVELRQGADQRVDFSQFGVNLLVDWGGWFCDCLLQLLDKVGQLRNDGFQGLNQLLDGGGETLDR